MAVMLGGGILFGAFSYMKSLQSVELQYEQPTITNEEELREQLTESQLNSVDIAIAYRKLYKDYSGKQQDLSALNGDDFVVHNAQMTFWVDSEDMERSYNIAKVYKNMIQSEDELGKESPGTMTEGIITAVLEEGANVLQVIIEHPSEEYCSNLAAAVADFVEEQQKTLKMQNLLGAHTVGLMSSSMGRTTEESNLMSQKNYIDQVINLKKTSEALEKALSAEEKAYFDYLSDGDGLEELSETASESQENDLQEDGLRESSLPRISVRYVLLGAVFFALAEMFIIFLKYTFNNRLRKADNFQDIYRIPQLGIVELHREKRILDFVDGWILKLRMRGKRQFTAEEATVLAAAAVKMAAKRASVNIVCLAGCNLQAKAWSICNDIKRILEPEGIEVEILNNVLYDVEGMEKLCEMQSVVLVETVESTLYEEIERELELMGRQNIKVLGGVIVT